jgi:hypothetical protein
VTLCVAGVADHDFHALVMRVVRHASERTTREHLGADRRIVDLDIGVVITPTQRRRTRRYAERRAPGTTLLPETSPPRATQPK